MAAAASHRHPAWYGAVMGTGALTMALAGQGATWDASWLTWLSVAGLLLTSVLAVALLPRYLRRVGDRSDLTAELADPARGPMLATLPAGLLVLAGAWGSVGPKVVPAGLALTVDGLLAAIGIAMALVLSLAWATAVMRTAPPLEAVNGGWLIPPVMNVIVPVAVAPLVLANPAWAEGLLVVALAFYGVGVLLFIVMLTLLVARLMLRGPLPAPLAPSMWIPLAPAGLIGVGLLRLEPGATAASITHGQLAPLDLVVAVMGIGFGLWWAAFAWWDLRRVRRLGGTPAQPGWWAYVFPVGAMTLSLTALGQATHVLGVEVLGAIATVILAAVWLLVAARTAGMLRPARQQSATPAR